MRTGDCGMFLAMVAAVTLGPTASRTEERHKEFNAWTSQGTSASPIVSGVVVSVSDGDSITVLAGGQRLPIRLEGIDCPEGGQPYGVEAEEFTRQLLLGRTVSFRVKERDDYGRLVARAYLADEDVSVTLVKRGFAWHFRRYSDDRRIETAEREARKAKLGLWVDPKARPPWSWRQDSPGSIKRAAPSHSPLHGNPASRLVHSASCRHYNCRACTVTFQSVGDALAAGYRLGACCTDYRR